VQKNSEKIILSKIKKVLVQKNSEKLILFKKELF